MPLSDLDDCINNPCQNGGVCDDLEFTYQCDCAGGYEGPDCSISKNN